MILISVIPLGRTCRCHFIHDSRSIRNKDLLYNKNLTKQLQSLRCHRNAAVLEEYGRLPRPSLPVEEVIPIMPFQEILKKKK